MNNTAIVNRTEGDRVFLMHIKDYGKKEKTEREFWKLKTLEFEGNNINSLNLKEGDAVEYHIPEGKTIFASFLILIVPLVVFITTFAFLGFLGLNSEKVRALFAIGLMIASFYITKLLKKGGYKETIPTILKIVEKSELSKKKTSCSDCGSCSACD